MNTDKVKNLNSNIKNKKTSQQYLKNGISKSLDLNGIKKLMQKTP